MMSAIPRRPDRVVKSKRLANGAERLEHYDFLGRLRLADEPDGSWLSYGYSDAGYVNRMEHSSGEVVSFFRTRTEIRAVTNRTETTIRLDARGFPTQLALCADGHEWTLDYRRDSCGRVLAMRYPHSADWLLAERKLRCGDQLYAELCLPRIRFVNGTSALEEWSEDKPARLRRIAHLSAAGEAALNLEYAYDETGRVSRAGVRSFGYDDQGRLIQCDERRYEFDGEGRVVRAGDQTLSYGRAPFVVESGAVRFDHDALGRRVARHSAAGTSRYTYNLFGQLASVELPDATLVRYLYDGFGRLVGRQAGGRKVYYLVDFEGRRIAECDAEGTVTRSYLWLGPQCVGMVRGTCGGPLTRSFHRFHGGTLAGIGDAAGRIYAVACADPYGGDAPIVDGIPGYACLFGDPETGLLYAASRWLDPGIGQFISADSWFGTDALKHVAPRLRRVLDALPGGTGRLLNRQSAYDWCGRDPVNYCDPNGHNFVGLIWSTISALLWSMQVTSISFQIEALSLLFYMLTSPIALFSKSFRDGFWHSMSPFNAIAPLLGSTRLMVPFAFPLNSFLSAGGDVFTMGNVIWTQGDSLESLESTAQRDLILCGNAGAYQAMTNKDAIVRLVKGEDRIARSVTFVAGQALHIRNQIPKGFPTEGLLVTEYLPAATSDRTTATATREAPLVRLSVAADQALFVANDTLRIRAGATYFARSVSRVHGSRDLVLQQALDAPGTTDFSRVEVVKLSPSGAAAASQTGAGTRVTAGTPADLRKGDGLAVENTGAAPVTTEVRIVTQVLLNCPIAALPNALLGVALAVDLMDVDASKRASGKVTANNQITTAAGEAGQLSKDQPVRVRKAGDVDAFATLAAVDNGANRLTLTVALSATDFPNGTAVSVNLMTATKRFEAEAAGAPGTQVTVKVAQPGSPAQNNVIRVRGAADVQSGELRKVTAPPTVAAELDSALPPTHANNNLSVQRMAPVANTLRDNAAAPVLQLRFTIQGGANPYTPGDELHFSQEEEAVEKVFGLLPGQVIELEDPIEHPLDGIGAIHVQRVTATGASTPDGKLAESLVLIPSDPGEEPITRRRAVETHEMRHVWQYAVLGPFFLFLPVPWLVSLGWSPDTATTGGKWTRYLASAGLTDDVFALIAWGVGKAAGKIPKDADLGRRHLDGEVTDASRKVIAFAADVPDAKFATFSQGAPCEVAIGDYGSYNFIDDINAGEKRITLRFALESDKFHTNDRVDVSVSPFENIRRTINQVFGGIFVSLWQDRLPPGWGKAFSRLLNRDSWLAIPPLGLYPLAFIRSGFERSAQKRIHFEQDASYHSGDLYTNFAVSDPNEVYVGQISRVMGFLQGRDYQGGKEVAVGMSDQRGNLPSYITIETPPAPASNPGLTPAQMVYGSVATPAGSGLRFGDRYFMRMSDKVENVVGAFFAASNPGDYVLHVDGELTEDVIRDWFLFSANFVELRKIKVKALGVSPSVSVANPIYETEQVRFKITGDPVASYAFRYAGPAPAPAIIFDARDPLLVTVPVLGAAAPPPHQLEITATYKATDSVFHGAGQVDPLGLTAAELTNVCQPLALNLAILEAPAVGPVAAGSRRQFQMPVAPASVTVTSAKPPGAAVNASVINGTGRPAQLTFIAPNTVTAATKVTFDMVFGSGAVTKTVTTTVQVTP